MGYERAQRNKDTKIHSGRSGGQALTDLNEFWCPYSFPPVRIPTIKSSPYSKPVFPHYNAFFF